MLSLLGSSSIDLVASHLVLFQITIQNCFTIYCMLSRHKSKFDLAVVKRLLRNAFVWYKCNFFEGFILNFRGAAVLADTLSVTDAIRDHTLADRSLKQNRFGCFTLRIRKSNVS